MIGKTHALAGACAALALNATGTGVVIATFGSLLPDIDCASSIVGKHAKTLANILPHRGPTHSFLMLVLALLVNPWLALGVTTHIILDMMTAKGLLLFWPIQKKIRFPFARYNSTNSKFELFFQLVLLAIAVAFCINSIERPFFYDIKDYLLNFSWHDILSLFQK